MKALMRIDLDTRPSLVYKGEVCLGDLYKLYKQMLGVMRIALRLPIRKIKFATLSPIYWFLLLLSCTTVSAAQDSQTDLPAESQIAHVTSLFSSHLTTITVIVSIASLVIAAFGLAGYVNVRNTSQDQVKALDESKERLSTMEVKHEDALKKSGEELNKVISETRQVRDEYHVLLRESRGELDKIIAQIETLRTEGTKLTQDLSRLADAALTIQDVEVESDAAAKYADSKTAEDVPLSELLIDFLRIHSRWNFNAKRICGWGAERYPALAGFKVDEVDSELKRLAGKGAVRTRTSSTNGVLYGYATKI